MRTGMEPPPLMEGGASIALRMEGIVKRFGAALALDGASLAVRPGTVHALLGENGAGKTTLMRIAFGLVSPDAGQMTRAGRAFAPRAPRDAITAGLGMVFQHFSLVPAMTIAENLALGGTGRFDPKAQADRVRALGDRTGLVVDPSQRVADASIGMQQRSEILKALSHDAEVLMLDEPTAVLPPSEAAELLGWLRRFADAGHAVVLVTHRLRDALAVADDVTVLRRGRTVLTARAESLDEATLASAMIGEAAVTDAAPAHVPARARDTVPVVLSTRGVWCDDGDGRTRLRDVSLAVRGGEVVGVAGIEGEGAAELLRVLAGRREPSRGEVVRPALLGFVPEDRHRDAVLLDRPLTENLALRNAGSRRGRMHWGEVARRAESLVGAFDVRASGVEVAMRTLSGGNQQKFVLARELADTPSALVVENPTRGLDIRATEAVRLALRQARAAGTAVVVYSSDIDELLALADRVVVVAGGRVVEVPTDRDAIAQAMVASVATASP